MSKRAHGSYRVWQKIANRVYSKTMPALKGPRTKGDWITIAAMIILACFGGTFFGYYFDTNLLHPPSQITETCPSPGYIQNGGCWINQSETVIVNGQSQVKTVQVPYGGQIISSSTNTH